MKKKPSTIKAIRKEIDANIARHEKLQGHLAKYSVYWYDGETLNSKAFVRLDDAISFASDYDQIPNLEVTIRKHGTDPWDVWNSH